MGDGLPQRRGTARPCPTAAGRRGTDTVVEAEVAGPLRCSHFDAFRFFTPEAVPRNAGSPSRATQQDWEQPGCLHANMDLSIWLGGTSVGRSAQLPVLSVDGMRTLLTWSYAGNEY
jgi:hypothetical protein